MAKELYLSLNRFLKKKFGEKVKKIPLDAGFLCPNRDGTKGRGGCIYCDPLGSGTGLYPKLTLKEQILFFKDKFTKRGYQKFIAYFQSFSNTYAPPEKLREIYSIVLEFPEIIGIAIGTRPDCIDEEIIRILKDFQSLGLYLWIELGLQSKHNETLKKINRGHTYEDFLEAFSLLKKNHIPVCVHIIFGLPWEDREMMFETVKDLARLYIDGIKFHALYVVKGTALAKLYEKVPFKVLTLEEYAEIVATAISLLPSTTVIHRLTSDPPRDTLITPLWLLEKNKILERIEEIMQERGLYQGKFFSISALPED